jgi:hypothetical protein
MGDSDAHVRGVEELVFRCLNFKGCLCSIFRVSVTFSRVPGETNYVLNPVY